MDMFTYGEGLLVPVLPVIRKLFTILSISEAADVGTAGANAAVVTQATQIPQRLLPKLQMPPEPPGVGHQQHPEPS